MNGKESKQAVDRRVTLEPMLEAQLIGQDTEGYLRMARTYYRWSKQLYRKLQIDHPEKLTNRSSVKITIQIRCNKPRADQSR